jgi:hypothetical protein
MSPALEKGIAAAKAGNKKEALRYLREVLLLDAKNANAWLWMSAMVDDPEKKRHCLKMVLELEPENQVARNGLTVLNHNFPPTVINSPAEEEQPLPPPSAAFAVPSQPLETSQPLSSDSTNSAVPVPSRPVPVSTGLPSQPVSAAAPISSKPVPASMGVPSRPISAAAPVSSTPVPASTGVPSRPVPAATPVSSQPVNPFTTPEIRPDDPALIRTQAIHTEGVKPVSPISKPAFLYEDETSSDTDQTGSEVSQSSNTSLAQKRKAERAARDRRWQKIIWILLALIIIITAIVIGAFVYPKIMNSNLSNILPPSGGLPTIKVPDLFSGTKQTPIPVPPQLGVFLVESGNYITLTPGSGRPGNADYPTTTNKLPVIVFYDPAIEPEHVKLFAVAGGIPGNEIIINLAQNQGIITSTIQTPLDNGFYCYVQSNSSLKPVEQKWWCFNEGSTDDAVDTSINISPPGNGFFILQNGTPTALTVSSEVISSAGSKLVMISPSRPIVIANALGVTPEDIKLVALVGGFGIQLSPTDSSIVKIYAGSPAETAALQTGDIILSVDGDETNQDFTKTEQLIEAPFGSASKLYVQRGSRQVTLTLTRSWVVDTTELAYDVVPKPGFFYLVPKMSLSPGAYCYEASKSSWCFGVQKLP